MGNEEEDGRKRGVPGVFVTRSEIGDGSATLRPLPAPSAVSATATACQGRGRDGRVPFSSGRQLPAAPKVSSQKPAVCAGKCELTGDG